MRLVAACFAAASLAAAAQDAVHDFEGRTWETNWIATDTRR